MRRRFDAPIASTILRIGRLGLVFVLGCTPPQSEPEHVGEPMQQSVADESIEPSSLPGAVGFPAAVWRQLEETMHAPPPQTLHTKHVDADGAPRFVNRLALSSSPYLRQHAHNPVNWFPWGEEAFALARAIDRPVFLSIGYSTCHWCHVMAEESFEDLAIAELLNRRYVTIKVDREERPDIDAIYMAAVRTLTGGGGWPMTVIMTPDGRPFFAATYVPARAGVRDAQQGLEELLVEIAGKYADDRASLLADADVVSRRVARLLAAPRSATMPDASAILRTSEHLRRAYDPVYGGIGASPKFPQPSLYRLLLRAHRRTGDERYLQVVEHTLAAMAKGGIRDHLAGGFHRYATDRTWLVPHFEKMLYDNAQLVEVYLEAYQVSGDERYAEVARDTLAYVLAEMTTPQGAFYSATDADSEGEEGRFFVWTPAQLEEALTAEENALATRYYGLDRGANFEGRNILTTPLPLVSVVAKMQDEDERFASLTPARAGELLASARAKLYAVRQTRVAPGLDDKVLTSWNGLMIGALARASFVLGDGRYLQAAERAADFVWNTMWRDGRLARVWVASGPHTLAFLDDYTALASASLTLFEATAAPRHLARVIALQAVLDEVFVDAENGGYYYSSTEHEKLLAREKPSYDGAEPSGNSVAAENLLRLAELTDQPQYRAAARAIFAGYALGIEQAGTGLARMLGALDFELDRALTIVIVEPREGGDVAPLMDVLRQQFLPNHVHLVVRDGASGELAEAVPIVDSKLAKDGRATAYVCEAGRCEAPTTDPAVFAQQIRKVRAYADTVAPPR